jgi:hypothetical protein
VVTTRVEELQSKVRAAEEKALAAERKLDDYQDQVRRATKSNDGG